MPRQGRHSVSKLNDKQRSRARRRAAQAALLGYRKRSAVHYTQGSRRWQGIARRDNSEQGEFPNYADCSAFATWCLWNALYLEGGFRVRDVVNDANWQAGYTGTMLQNGKRVRHLKNVRRGDLVLYGRPGTTGAHVAIVVGRKNGVPVVVSHGSEGGPYLLPYNYRRDIMQIRRYI